MLNQASLIGKMGTKSIAFLIAIVLSASLAPVTAFASQAFISANAPNEFNQQFTSVQPQAKKKVKWFKIKFKANHLKVTKKGFRTKGKVQYSTSLKKFYTSPKTAKKKTRSFKLASRVRWYGSDGLSSQKMTKKASLSRLKSFAHDPYHGMAFKVKNGKVVQIRLLA